MPIRQPTALSSRSEQASLDLDVVPIRTTWQQREWSFMEFCLPSVLNGCSYEVNGGGEGMSGSTEPNWPTTVGATVVDGNVTWTCYPQSGTLEKTATPSAKFAGWSTALCFLDLPDGGAADLEIKCTYRDGTTDGWGTLWGSMDESFLWTFFRAKNNTALGQIASIAFRWGDSVVDERFQWGLVVEASGLYQG